MTVISNIKEKLKNRILLEKKKFIFNNFLLSIIVMLPILLCYTTLKHLIMSFIFLIILFLLSISNRFLFFTVSIFIIITSIVFSHIYIHWGYLMIDSRLEVALLSPLYEQIEYLKNYFSISDYFLFIYTIIYIYLLFKYMKLNSFFLIYNIKLKSISILFVVFLISIISVYKNPLTEILPFNIAYKYIQIKDKLKLIQNRNNYINYLAVNKHHLSKNLLYDKIIIIIGESASKKHMSAYSYKRKTTPFLDSFKNQQNGYFYNAIAPANQTRYSLALSFTNAKVNDFNHFFTSYSLITKLKQNGYYTYWISNQGQVGKHDNYISSIANETDIKYFLNINFKLAKPDSVLLKKLNEINIDDKEKQAFVFHLIGSHFDYQSRYPKNKSLIKDPKSIIDYYDNTIYFTDYILSKIYQKFKNKKILFVYFSDHGEVISDKKHGHGFFPPYKDEYDIPLFIYSSIPNKKLNIINNKERINMETFNYLIEYLSGIDNNLSLISSSNYVMALKPQNIFNYLELKNYKGK